MIKWSSLIATVIIGAFLLYRASNPNSSEPSPGARGVAERFLIASRAGHIDQAEALAEAGQQAGVANVARTVNELHMANDWVPIWQLTQIAQGADAYQVQMTGKSKVLMVEFGEAQNGQFAIHNAVLSDM